ncbi:hypothetical protein [Conexibacter sp. SYSU D00693]|uniref:hypothetical protein n=1 Tax=Conexibacter sp. SYSU D00693 TaxID=2812560 RepID=UPI00196B8786|nr:hypothetical protein [Conexibacter sp. SYSU D00693]
MRASLSVLLAAALLGVAPSVAAAAVGSGCGPDGPTRAAEAPFATVAVPALAVDGRRVRLTMATATQTAGAVLRLAGEDGTVLAATPAGAYACTTAGARNATVTVPLTAAGRTRLRALRRLELRGTLTLTNGSGVTRAVAISLLAVDGRLLARNPAGRCRAGIASPTRVGRGDPLGVVVRACSTGRVRVALLAREGPDRGEQLLRRTVRVRRGQATPEVLSLGEVPIARYRLVLLDANGKVLARQLRDVRVRFVPQG